MTTVHSKVLVKEKSFKIELNSENFEKLTIFIRLSQLQLLANESSARWLRVQEDDVKLFAAVQHDLDYFRHLDVEYDKFFVGDDRCHNLDSLRGDHNLE